MQGFKNKKKKQRVFNLSNVELFLIPDLQKVKVENLIIFSLQVNEIPLKLYVDFLIMKYFNNDTFDTYSSNYHFNSAVNF